MPKISQLTCVFGSHYIFLERFAFKEEKRLLGSNSFHKTFNFLHIKEDFVA